LRGVSVGIYKISDNIQSLIPNGLLNFARQMPFWLPNFKGFLMYAIIKHGGKQYKVEEGNYLNLDHFNAEPKAKLELSEVLALNDGELKVGAPFVKGAKVILEVVCEGKDKKVVIFKKRRRKDSKVKRGFRRQYTRVKVVSINA
jgi:ribosomal protein L21